MIQARRFNKLGLLGSLYLSQSMPFLFLYQALPVVLRQEGLSLTAIGLLPLVVLPITLKFLWSPLIDRYSFTVLGHYRFWIILLQSVVAMVTALCSLLSVSTQLPIVLMGMLIIAIGCASQDIATDALALGLLEPQERGLGNAVQSVGGSLGSMIGGGGMLILLSRWGWRGSLLTLAGLMLVALIPVLLHQEKPKVVVNHSYDRSANIRDRLRNYFTIFLHFCQRPGMKVWLCILLLYNFGYSLSITMFRPLLIDLGLSLAEVGWLLGIVGTCSTIFGSLAAGLLIPPLGRQRTLLIASSLSAIGMLTYAVPTLGLTQLSVLYSIVGVTSCSLGMVVTTAFTIMMDKSYPETAATDYAIQASLNTMGSLPAAAISGVLASGLGYRGVFVLSAMIMSICVVLIARYLGSSYLSNSSTVNLL
ncbi:MFS transporter [Pantanalinema sp. GBBB05]|uniref:MFS transporter n=1 Tax=Pantanalinema sp. GBBB05 TaxID=2604139 RepID=UPI003D817D7A